MDLNGKKSSLLLIAVAFRHTYFGPYQWVLVPDQVLTELLP